MLKYTHKDYTSDNLPDLMTQIAKDHDCEGSFVYHKGDFYARFTPDWSTDLLGQRDDEFVYVYINGNIAKFADMSNDKTIIEVETSYGFPKKHNKMSDALDHFLFEYGCVLHGLREHTAMFDANGNELISVGIR